MEENHFLCFLAPLSQAGKLSPGLKQELYAEVGGAQDDRIGLLTRTEGCGIRDDAAAEQHALVYLPSENLLML